MEKTAINALKADLTEMKKDLLQVKKAAEELMEDLKDAKPEDISLDSEMAPDKKEEHPVEIKTPEDAKKVLNEAVEDIQQVIDKVDGLAGQADEEVEKVAFKRSSDKYASTIQALASTADKAIEDATSALNHWSFLKNRIKVKEAALTNPALRDTLTQVKEAHTLLEGIKSFLGFNKQATAVPPTGAEFTGDKFPNKKNPADIENHHWEAGAQEFKKNKKKEDSMVNPATETRLTDAGNPHDEKPFVNASLFEEPGNKFGSFWVVADSKVGKQIKVAFVNIPPKIGPRNEYGFSQFSSKEWGIKLAERVTEIGLESVRTLTGGEYVHKTASLSSTAVEKGSIKKYYAEAYGDASYAKDLVAGDTKKMDTAYVPKEKTVKDADTNTKDGAGKLSSVEDPAVIKAKAHKMIGIAKKAAAAGIIDFNKQSLKSYASDLMKKSDAAVDAIEDTLDHSVIYNEAALKEAHIPDTESGVIGNTATGVSDPKSQVSTEDVNKNVASDAKIASFVPQMQKQASVQPEVASMFTTLEKRLQEKGVDLTKTRVRKASYRN